MHTTPYGQNHEGLDLMYTTLNAMIKYPWPRKNTGNRSRKWGHYDTEENEFSDVRQLKTPGPNDGVSLESRIMDWADDVTYAIHDMIDFYKAGLVPVDELGNNRGERENFVNEFRKEYSSIPDRWDAEDFMMDKVRKIGQVAGHSQGNALTTSFDGSSRDLSTLGFLASELIERYIGVGPGHDAISVNPNADTGLDIKDELVYEVKFLKFLTEHYVFNDPALIAQQHGQRRLVEELFDILYSATEEESEYRGIIHPPFDEKVNSIHDGSIGYTNIDEETLRARVVADLVASMTEQQTLQLYKRLSGHSPGLVTDRIVTP